MTDASLPMAAAAFAAMAHGLQKREASGQPNIQHPLRVASRVALNGGTPEMQAAAVLHDVLEDTPTSHETLGRLFPAEVVAIVWWLTNPPKEEGQTRAQRVAFNHDRLSWAPPEVQTIKLLDRADNLTDEHGDDDEWLRLYITESEHLLLSLSRAAVWARTELQEAILIAKMRLHRVKVAVA
jgi:(p)ppGpp synthase/HD superfamily hydrolase